MHLKGAKAWPCLDFAVERPWLPTGGPFLILTLRINELRNEPSQPPFPEFQSTLCCLGWLKLPQRAVSSPTVRQLARALEAENDL